MSTSQAPLLPGQPMALEGFHAMPRLDMARVAKVRPALGGFTEDQIVAALGDEGLVAWSSALAITGKADDAFTLTMRRPATRQEKIRFYSLYFGERADRLEANLESFEQSGAIFADPHKMREARAQADQIVRSLDDRYAGKTPEQLRAEILQTFGQEQDQARKIEAYAQIIGRTPAFVAANLEQVEQHLLVEATAREIERSQRVREFYENPANLGVMRDNAGALTRLESLLVSRHSGFGAYLGVNLTGQLRDFTRSVLGVSLAGKELTNALGNLVGVEVFEENQLRVLSTLLRDLQDETVRLTREAGGGGSKTWSDILGGVAQMATYIGVGAATGLPVLPLAMIGAQESGNIYADLRQEGAPLLGAALPALTVGVVNTALEKAQLGGIEKMLGLRNKLQKFAYENAGQLVLNIFTQGGQEVLQNLVSEVGSYAGELTTPAGVQENPFELLDRALAEGLYEGGVAAVGALLFATMAAPRVLAQGRQLAQQRAGVARLAMAQAQVSNLNGKGVTPELVTRAGQQVLAGTPGEYSSLPASEVQRFFQQAPDLRGDFLAKLGVTEEEFQEALQQNRQITFQTMNWLSKIGETKAGLVLTRYLSVGDYISAAEYADLEVEVEALAKDAATQLADMATAEEATPEEILAFRRGLIEKAGYSAEQADAIVAVLDRGLRIFAAKRGETLADLAKRLRLGLWVEGVDPGDPQVTSEAAVAQDPVQRFTQLSRAVFAHAQQLGLASPEVTAVWTTLEELTRLDSEIRAAIREQRPSTEELDAWFEADAPSREKYVAAVARVNEALGTTLAPLDESGQVDADTFAKLSEMHDAGAFKGTGLTGVRNAIAPFLAGHARMNAFEINQVLGKRKDLAAVLRSLQTRIDETFGATPIIETEGEETRIPREPIENRPKRLKSGTEINTKPQFGGFGRTFTQTFLDYLPDQVFENFRQALTKAVEAAYAAGKVQGTFPVKFIDKLVETISDSELAVAPPLKVAEKTNLALNLSSACPMFIIGAHGCYLDGCYVTGLGMSGNTINYYSRAAYTGEILQLAQEDIDLLNAVGGLRVNGMGDLTYRQYNQLKDAVRHAGMRGLNLKVITKQDATFAMFEQMRQEGLSVAHVSIQPSLDPYWVPITEDDLVDSFANQYHLVQSWLRMPTPEMAEQIVALYQAMGREAMVIDGVLYRKYGYSVEKFEALRRQYPELNLVPRVVVGTPEEILYFAKHHPRYLQTWMHASIREGLYSTVHGRMLAKGEIGNFTARLAIFRDEEGRWQIQAQGKQPKGDKKASSRAMALRKRIYQSRQRLEKLAHKRKPTTQDAEALAKLRDEVKTLMAELKSEDEARAANVPTETRALYDRVRDTIEADPDAELIFRRMTGMLDNEPSSFCCAAGADKNTCNTCTSHCNQWRPGFGKGVQVTALEGLLQRIDQARRGMRRKLASYTQPPVEGPPQPRGASDFFSDGSVLIRLFTSADRSTVLHEFGHVFAELMRETVEAGTADARLQADWAALQAAIDAQGIEAVMSQWEAYLMEGKAPSVELLRPFILFARWLKNIYVAIKRLLAPFGLEQINPELREVFDRWLATEDEQRLAEDAYRSTDSLAALLQPKPAPQTAPGAPGRARTGDPHAAAQKLAERLGKARRALQEARDKALAAEVARRLKAQLQELGGIQALRKRVQAELAARPVYAAVSALRRRVVTREHADGTITQETLHGVAEDLLLSIAWTDTDASIAAGHVAEPPGDTVAALRARHGGIIGPGIQSLAELNEFARSFGFIDARAMIRAMLDAPSLQDAVRARADELRADLAAQIRAEMGPQVPPGTAMVHIDATLDYLVADLMLAEEKLGRAQDRRMSRAVAEFMRQRVRQHLEELEPVRRARSLAFFSRAEARAASRAFTLAKRGDAEEALRARREQIYYHIAVMEALRLREQAATILRRWKKANWDKVEEHYRNLALDILTTYGFIDAEPPDWAKPNELYIPDEGWVGTEDNASEVDAGLRGLLPTYTTMIPMWVRAKIRPGGPTNIRTNPNGEYRGPEDLTFAQLQTLDEILSWAKTMGRKELKALLSAQIRTLEELAQASIVRMDGLPDARVRDLRTGWGRAMNLKDRSLAALKVVEFLFEQADGSPLLRGAELGPLHHAFNRFSDAQAAWQARWNALLDGDAAKGVPSLREALQALAEAQARLEKEHGTYFDVPGVPMPEALRLRRGYQKWGVDQVLAVCFNRGNDANMHRLMHSDLKLTAEQIDILCSLLTSAEWDAIQQMWDVVNSLYPEMADVRYRLTNSRPPKEPAVPFTVRTADGQIKELRGGYYPLYSDPLISAKAGAIEDAKVILDEARKQAIYARQKANTSFTRERARDKNGNPLAELPVLLTTATLVTHLRDVTLFIHMAEAIQELHWLTLHPAWSAKFKEKFGDASYNSLRHWLNYQANPERRSTDVFSSMMDWMRTKFVSNVLGLKLFVSLKQREAYGAAVNHLAAGGVGRMTALKYLGIGMRDVGLMANLGGRPVAAIRDEIHRLSKYMPIRESAIDRDLRDFVNKMRHVDLMATVTRFNEHLKTNLLSSSQLQEVVFWLIKTQDLAVVYPVWWGAYTLALDKNLNGITPGMEIEERQRRAAEYADVAVRMSQSSAMPADQAAVQRLEGGYRLFACFMTEKIKKWNRTVWYVRDPDLGWNEKVAHFALERILPVWIYMLGPALLYGDDDRPQWYDFLLRPGFEMLAAFPILNEGVSTLRYGEQGVPAFDVFARGQRIQRAIQDADAGKLMLNLWQTFEWFWGVPVSNIPLELLRVARKIES